MHNTGRAVIWLMVVQQPSQMCNKHTGYEYIQIISEHQITNFLPPVIFNQHLELVSRVGISDRVDCISLYGWFNTSAHPSDMSTSQMIYILQYRGEESLALTMLQAEMIGCAFVSPDIYSS
jgi:hypothetical protein